MANYESYTMLVKMNIVDDGEATWAFNPSSITIPDNTIATITWGIDPSTSNQIEKFKDFSWHGGGKSFMSNHTLHHQHVFMGFNNTASGNNNKSGTFIPVITVKGTDDKTHASPASASDSHEDARDNLGGESYPTIKTGTA